jgi:hypothetical protein
LNVNLGKHKVEDGEDDDYIDDEDGENMSLKMIMNVMINKTYEEEEDEYYFTFGVFQ